MTPQQLLEERKKYGIPEQGYMPQASQESINNKIVALENVWGIKQEAQQAETEAGKGLGRRFLSALPGGIAQTLVGTPAKFLASTKEIPEVIKTGKATNKSYNVPLVGQTTSFQTDILKRPENLQGSTLGDVWNVAQVPLAGLETGVLASGAYKGAKAGIQATKQLFAKTAEKNALKDALEIILPKKMTPTKLEERVKQGGVTYKGFITKTAEPIASKFEKEVADTVKNIVKSKLTPDKNINLIKNKIGSVSENFVRPNLAQYPVTPDLTNQLLTRIQSIPKPTLLKSNTTLDNTYKVVSDTAEDLLKTQKYNTMDNLWDARKIFDDIADEAKLLEPTQRSVAAKAVRDIRNVWNEFIIDNIPDGQKLYGTPVKEMGKMYRAIDMIADNTPSKIIAHPALATSLKWFGRVVKYSAAGIGIGWLAKKFGSGGWDAGL